jgi:hypothetical protein
VSKEQNRRRPQLGVLRGKPRDGIEANELHLLRTDDQFDLRAGPPQGTSKRAGTQVHVLEVGTAEWRSGPESRIRKGDPRRPQVEPGRQVGLLGRTLRIENQFRDAHAGGVEIKPSRPTHSSPRWAVVLSLAGDVAGNQE